MTATRTAPGSATARASARPRPAGARALYLVPRCTPPGPTPRGQARPGRAHLAQVPARPIRSSRIRSSRIRSSQIQGRPRRPLRLTRRGRLALLALLMVACGGLFLVLSGVGAAGTRTGSVPVRYVSVESGDTLWGIAGRVAPGVDRRETVRRIVELNALPGALLDAGQRIAVPAT